MKLEVLVRWTELMIEQVDEDEAMIRRLKDGDEESMQAKFYYDYGPMVIDTLDIMRYNRSKDSTYTTIKFTDGTNAVIKYPYKEFHEVYKNAMQCNIISIVPEDYIDNKGNDGGLDILDGF